MCLAAGLLTACFLGACSPERRRAIVRTWARSLLCAAGVRVRIRGPSPSGISLLVANHVSWLDIVAIAAIEPATFVSKADVAEWPLIGMLVAQAGTLFIHRDRFRAIHRVTRDMNRRLEEGDSIVVFPEGTTSDGRTLLRFGTGIFEPAVTCGVPITPIAITYSSAAANFVGDMTFAASLIRILRARDLEAYLAFSGPIDTAHVTRRRAAAEASSRIAAVLAAPRCRAAYRSPGRSPASTTGTEELVSERGAVPRYSRRAGSLAIRRSRTPVRAHPV